MQIVLEEKGQWEIVRGEEMTPDDEAEEEEVLCFQSREHLAYVLIYLSLGDGPIKEGQRLEGEHVSDHEGEAGEEVRAALDNHQQVLEPQPQRERMPFALLRDNNFIFIIGLKGDAEPNLIQEIKLSEDWEDWQVAIREKLKSHKENGTWEWSRLPTGRKVVDSKWVFRVKRGDNGDVVKDKAKLVARGFDQVEGLDYTDTFALVVAIGSILLAYASAYGWAVHQMDVKKKNLHGEVDEEIYMQPAPESKCKQGQVYRL
ncbi:hypothetical protein L7F22_005310 [Adiantum nelumboides]|nr:hypothetical protein [Adiantum nelumboides]